MSQVDFFVYIPSLFWFIIFFILLYFLFSFLILSSSIFIYRYRFDLSINLIWNSYSIMLIIKKLQYLINFKIVFVKINLFFLLFLFNY